MSRLNDLLRRLENSDPALAKDLKREVDALAGRRAFGLNFERHAPEAVELPGRPVRRGDKVRILPPRGSKVGASDDRLWRVVAILKDDKGSRTASIELIDDENEDAEVLVEDLVVVAEFRDTIYPGLVSTGRVEKGGDKPYHSVINAENYHALQTLLFTHRARIDAIYIDPPYNTGAKDWKYSNDYVEGEDLYRHSKWLAFMERRLKLAKELLNPDDSVLIVTIDEKEYLRLGLLLEQVFPEARIQMISSVIKPGGVSRNGHFARSDEYLFFVMIGDSKPQAIQNVEGFGFKVDSNNTRPKDPLYWNTLWRSGSNARRGDRPDLFYPIYVDVHGKVLRAGPPVPAGVDRTTVDGPQTGETIIWPIRQDGSEGRWQLGPDTLLERASRGFVKCGRMVGEKTRLYNLSSGEIKKIDDGSVEIIGRREDGSVVASPQESSRALIPTSQWSVPSHDATRHGTLLLSKLLPNRTFPFPKSLYAVEDCLRFFVKDKPDAVVLDFFSGSGTTAHAVMRLNHHDGGGRQCISITNNEVSAEEQKSLRKRGLRPGDLDWESVGICDFITKPRVEAAVTGMTPDGDQIKGDYKFTDEFPMSDGLEENVEFFTLTYEAPLRVSSNRDFARIAPLLWMRAGSVGRRIDEVLSGWDVAETYGVLADLNQSDKFIETLIAKEGIRIVFIVTDEDRLFESVVRELPDHIEPVRMYEAYLQNFEIETSRSAL